MYKPIHSQFGFAKLAIASIIGIVIIFSALAIVSMQNPTEQNTEDAVAHNPSVGLPNEAEASTNINEVSLAPGVTADVSGLLITFNELVQDNRCATDVVCIEAGAVTLNITLETNGITMTRNISSDEVPTEFEGRKISIIKAMPEAVSTVSIQPQDYRITFKID